MVYQANKEWYCILKITIITVCRNSQETIETSIQSVIAQTYKNIEYIIIDGNSSDSTLSIINKYFDNISCIISEPDGGIYDAMNKGIKSATGDYIYFLNSDDRLLHRKVIENVVKDIKPVLPDIVYGDILTFNESEGTAGVRKQNYFNKIYVFKNTPDQPTVFYKKSVFEKCGIFRTDYTIVSDFDWMLNAILRNNVSLQYTGKVITQFASGGVSSHRHCKTLEEEMTKVFQEYFPGFEGIICGFFSRYLRSLTRLPLISGIINSLFRFNLKNTYYTK